MNGLDNNYMTAFDCENIQAEREQYEAEQEAEWAAELAAEEHQAYLEVFRSNLRQAAQIHRDLRVYERGCIRLSDDLVFDIPRDLILKWSNDSKIRSMVHERDALRDSARRWAIDAGWL